MATSLKSTIKINVTGTLIGTPLQIGQANYNFVKAYTQSFTNGVGINQANNIWADTRTILASANDDINLSGGIINAYNTAITFTSIKALLIKAAATNTNNLIIGAQGVTPFSSFFGAATHTLIVPPNGLFLLENPNIDGYPVTPTTNLLRIANSAGVTTVSYDIIIIGETA